MACQVGSDSIIDISIVNLRGQTVENLVNDVKQTGQYSVYWDAKDIASGIYLVRMHAYPKRGLAGRKTPFISSTEKIILLK